MAGIPDPHALLADLLEPSPESIANAALRPSAATYVPLSDDAQFNPEAAEFMPLAEAARRVRAEREMQLVQESDEWQRMVTELQAALQASWLEKDSLLQQLNECKQWKHRLVQSLQAERTKVVKVEGQLEVEREKHSMLKCEHNLLLKQFHDKKVAFSEIVSASARLSDELQAARDQVATLETDLLAVQQEYIDLETNFKRFADQASVLREVVDNGEEEDERDNEVDEDDDSIYEQIARDMWQRSYLKMVYVESVPVFCIYNPASSSNSANQNRHVPGIFQHCASAGYVADTMADSFSELTNSDLIGVLGQLQWQRDTTLDSCWLKVHMTQCGWCSYVGIVAGAMGRKAMMQAFGLGKASIFAAFSPSAGQYTYASYGFDLETYGIFQSIVRHILVELTPILASVPEAPSWKSAKQWLLKMQVPGEMRELIETGQEVRIPVHLLRFTQNDISPFFKMENGIRMCIHQASKNLWMQWGRGADPVASVPPLSVVLDLEGNLWSLDNRRLAELKMLQSLVVELVTARCVVHAWHRQFPKKKSTCTDGLGIECYRR